MNKEEMGQMESRLSDIELRIRDMDADQTEKAIEEIAGYMLALIEEIKTIKLLIGRVDHNTRLDI